MMRWLLATLLIFSPALAQAGTWEDCMQNDDLKKKVTACNQVVEAKKDNSKDQTTALLHRAYAHRLLKSWDESLADASEVIRRNPEWGRAYYERGMVLRQREEYRAAVRDLDVAARLMADKPFVWLARGRVNHLLGNYWSAAQDLSEAVRLNPDYALAYDYRAQVRCEQGRAEDAVTDWLTAMTHDRERIAKMKDRLRKRGFWEGDDSGLLTDAFEEALLSYSSSGCPVAQGS